MLVNTEFEGYQRFGSGLINVRDTEGLVGIVYESGPWIFNLLVCTVKPLVIGNLGELEVPDKRKSQILGVRSQSSKHVFTGTNHSEMYLVTISMYVLPDAL